jgi:ABC-type phosphate transport system substrate-binding protein
MKKNRALPKCERLLFLLACLLVALLSERLSAQVLIIANPGVKATEVSNADLRDVFTGVANEIKGGGHVTPVLLKQGAISDDFLNKYIGRSDSAFRTGWRSVLFSGQGVMPRTLDSEAAVVEYVARTAGAIGYIGKGAQHEGVKILVVK